MPSWVWVITIVPFDRSGANSDAQVGGWSFVYATEDRRTRRRLPQKVVQLSCRPMSVHGRVLGARGRRKGKHDTS